MCCCSYTCSVQSWFRVGNGTHCPIVGHSYHASYGQYTVYSYIAIDKTPCTYGHVPYQVGGQKFPYQLVIDFHQYNNFGLSDRTCCDSRINCTDECDIALSLCVLTGGASDADRSCKSGYRSLGIVGGSSVTFTDVVGKSTNPIALRVNILPDVCV